MREKPLELFGSPRRFGITPAYAGKTPRCASQQGLRGDHPRVCGKNYVKLYIEAWCAGSPPRMREKPICTPFRTRLSGITPAYAGKTTSDNRDYYFF